MRIHDDNLRLFAVSLLILFLEIFLIRWISTEIRVFAYVNNLILLACFLGVGAGCYLSRRNARVVITIGILAFVSLAAKSPLFQGITDMLSGFSDSPVWGEAMQANSLIPALKGAALTAFMFLAVSAAFVPLGQILGRSLDKHGNIIVGYSVNIAGSLAGVWVFNIFSFFYTKPWVWFAFSLIILFLFIPRTRLNMLIAASASIIILSAAGIFDFSPAAVWSPYQKLNIYPYINAGVRNGYVLNVNNVGYMTLLDLSDDFIRRYPRQYDISMRRYGQYELPYQFSCAKDSALILGAGAGNDAAGALRSGVRDIDAVEIDPGIYRLGLKLHPECPYGHGNVNMVIDDARAFLKKTRKKYDIISFGLLDSHVLSSNYNNMRLDHYIYTQEGFRDAKKRLKDDGVVSVIFEIRRKWLGARIYGLLRQVFGGVPYVFRVKSHADSFGWGGVMFVTGNNLDRLKKTVESNPGLKESINKNSLKFEDSVKLTTDDWPYLYIEKPSIPRMYLLIVVSVLLVILAAMSFLTAPVRGAANMHFFFLGCAFLLLEFQNISKSALLFGSTWIVNSYVISSILALILSANLFVYYVKIKGVKFLYLLLFLSVAILYLIPAGVLNSFGYWGKSVLAVTILNLPVFFASVIFMHSFKNAASKNAAFGSNLVGAAAGGLLETLSFITGVKSLLALVFLLYLMSFFCLYKNQTQPRAA